MTGVNQRGTPLSPGQEPEPKSSEGSGDDGTHSEDSKGTEGQNSPQDGVASVDTEDLSVQPAEGAPTFKNPLLKDKSPEEIERLFDTQQNAIKEQNQELNRLHVKASAPPAPAQPAPTTVEEDDDIYGDDFIAPKMKVLEKRLGDRLEAAVAPLRESVTTQNVKGVREQLRGELRHFEVLEPHIDQLIRQNNMDPATVERERLINLYHTVVGMATEQGINLNAATGESSAEPTPQPKSEEPPMSIPQHRPSAAPLPPDNSNKTPPRQLTEAERRLAREYFPNAKDPETEYRRLQDAGEHEIVTPGFSRQGWE